MLTEGDRVQVKSGDFSGQLGSVTKRPSSVTGMVRVDLDGIGELYVGDYRLRVVESHDPVSTPSHYRSHPSGVECIDITKHMSFPLGSAVKYIWRADLKGNAIEDLRKAAEYLRIEIEKREAS